MCLIIVTVKCELQHTFSPTVVMTQVWSALKLVPENKIPVLCARHCEGPVSEDFFQRYWSTSKGLILILRKHTFFPHIYANGLLSLDFILEFDDVINSDGGHMSPFYLSFLKWYHHVITSVWENSLTLYLVTEYWIIALNMAIATIEVPEVQSSVLWGSKHPCKMKLIFKISHTTFRSHHWSKD